MDKIDELAIERGCDIHNYSGKWCRAKDIALRADKASYPEGSAAEYAYRLFVELGGHMAKGFYGVLAEGDLG